MFAENQSFYPNTYFQGKSLDEDKLLLCFALFS